jgi:small subunit ribosomal protein S6
MKYELMYVLSPELTEDKRNKSIKQIDSILKENKAEVFHVDDWGKRDMAYTIKGFSEAYYIIYYFQVDDASFLPELEEEMKLDGGILRHMVIKRDDDFEVKDYSSVDEEENKRDMSPGRLKTKKSPITNSKSIDYKNLKVLKQYISRYGKIVARRYTKVNLKEQKQLAQSIKRARHMALLPFVR